MMNAKRQLSDESHSIHLVPKAGVKADVAAEVPANLFYPYLQLPQSGSKIPFDSSAQDGSTETCDQVPRTALDPATVLRELFELLEDYSPVWYTEEHHHRAVAALKGSWR